MLTKLRALTPVILGVIAALGQAPQDWWFVTLIALAVWLAWPVVSAKSAFRAGWLFGFGYFAVSLRWIVSPFLVEPDVTGWMAPFGILFMALGGGLFWALSRWAAYRIAPNSLSVAALMLIGAEVTRSYILTGFPWALLGHIWIDTPLAQLAAFGGPHLLTAITVGLALALTLLWQRRYGAALATVLAVIAWVTLTLPAAPVVDGPIVRLVQPNARQVEKWDPEHAQKFFNRLVDFTAQGERPDLVVWPETAISYLLEYAGDALDEASDAARGAPIVLGINRREGARYYNALVTLERGAIISSVYDKAHIVPFGEFIPGGELLRKVGIDGFSAALGNAFTPGPGPRTIDITGIGYARPLICYEGIFAEEIGTDERPRLMILVTNDAWFGPSAGPKQHLAQARLRAIEQGLPMVRVANTGISAMIDGKGRITAEIGMNMAAFIDAPLPLALPATVYSQRGDWPILLVLLMTLLACVVAARRK